MPEKNEEVKKIEKFEKDQKFYTPQEVALAAIKKCQELYKNSTLAKANTSHELEIGAEPNNDDAEAPEQLQAGEVCKEGSFSDTEKKGSKKKKTDRSSADEDADGDIDGDDVLDESEEEESEEEESEEEESEEEESEEEESEEEESEEEESEEEEGKDKKKMPFEKTENLKKTKSLKDFLNKIDKKKVKKKQQRLKSF